MSPPLDLETTAGLPFDVFLSLLPLLFSYLPGLGGLWSQSVFPRLVAPTQLCCSRPGQLCSFESLLPQLLDALEASQMFEMDGSLDLPCCCFWMILKEVLGEGI